MRDIGDEFCQNMTRFNNWDYDLQGLAISFYTVLERGRYVENCHCFSRRHNENNRTDSHA
jgi:hypothetical protein